jgi:hypothetical protein
MKKIAYYTIGILLLVFSSCKEDAEDWDSSVHDLSGEWYVRYDHATYGEDPFGAGYTHLLTFNTADDDGTEMWLTDDGAFWDYKVRIPVMTDSLKFGSDNPAPNQSYDIEVKIMNGKVIRDAVTLPSGYVADSIYFEVWFEDLEDATEIPNDKLLVGGYRKTGFEEDEP